MRNLSNLPINKTTISKILKKYNKNIDRHNQAHTHINQERGREKERVRELERERKRERENFYYPN